jgi:hypothetical protein
MIVRFIYALRLNKNEVASRHTTLQYDTYLQPVYPSYTDNTGNDKTTIRNEMAPHGVAIRYIPAACSPPITLMRALGHAHRKRGSYERPHMP